MEETPTIDRPGQPGAWPGLATGLRGQGRRLAFGLLAVSIVTAGGLGWYWHQRPVQIPIKYLMVKPRDIVAAVTATGQVEAMRELDATALVAGVVQDVLVDEGDRVQQGQALARLNDSEYAKKLQDAQAELERLLSIDLPQDIHALEEVQKVTLPQAQIAIRQAQLSLLDQERNEQMTRQLYENQAESKMNLDSAVAKRDKARLDVDNAREAARGAQIKLVRAHQDIAAVAVKAQQFRQNIAYIQKQIAGLTIRSPLTGIVTRKSVNPGVALPMGGPAFTVSDTAHLRVNASINELEAGKIREGQPVEVTMDALPGKIFRGHIYQIAPRAALQTSNDGFTAIRILARLDRGAAQLRPGNTVRTRIIAARHSHVLSLPLEAVLTDKQGARVVYLERNGKAHAQKVKVGLSDLRFVEITAGLKPMNLVIVSYGKELAEDSPVAEQKETAPAVGEQKRANPHGF